MSLVRPIGQPRTAFDARYPSEFSFVSNGGDQVVKHRLTILDNATGEVAYNNIVESYIFQQTVPANTLQNGKTYNFNFVVYNILGDFQYQMTPVVFRCYNNPTITLDNMPTGSIVKSANYQFTFTYNQIQEELLDSLVINLYNSAKVLIDTSGNKYSASVPPISFNYEAEGLEDNQSYFIEAKGVTVWGTEFSTDKIPFTVAYSKQDIYSTISIESMCSEGYTKIGTNLLAISGSVNPPPAKYVTYEGNIELDLSDITTTDYTHNTNVQWGEGFSINDDFEIRLWLQPALLGRIGSFWKPVPNKPANQMFINLRRGLQQYGDPVYSRIIQKMPIVGGSGGNATSRVQIPLYMTEELNNTVVCKLQSRTTRRPFGIEYEDEDGVVTTLAEDVLEFDFSYSYLNLQAKYYIVVNISCDIEVNYFDTKFIDYFDVTTNDGLNVRSNYIEPINNNSIIFVGIKRVNDVWTTSYQSLKYVENVLNWGEWIDGEYVEAESNVEYNKVTNLQYVQDVDSLLAPHTDTIVPLDTPFDTVDLYNGLFDHFTVDSAPQQYIPISTNKPIGWEDTFALNANFDNNVDAGNLTEVLDKIRYIKIKRRRNGDTKWITLKTIETTKLEDFDISLNDYFTPSNESFQYAIVPVIEGGVEGTYIISDKYTASFNGLFITDGITTFKLYNGVTYNVNDKTYHTGVLEPIGAKYPIVVYNSKNRYNTLGIQGNILGYNYEKTRRIDRGSVIKEVNNLIEFLTNNRPKIIKDWNGNIYLGRVINNINRNTDLINGYEIVNFNFVEQGDYNNYNDLVNNGLVKAYEY